MIEHNLSIRKLNEFSTLHNKAIKPINKPFNVFKNNTGFDIPYKEERAIKR